MQIYTQQLFKLVWNFKDISYDLCENFNPLFRLNLIKKNFFLFISNRDIIFVPFRLKMKLIKCLPIYQLVCIHKLALNRNWILKWTNSNEYWLITIQRSVLISPLKFVQILLLNRTCDYNHTKWWIKLLYYWILLFINVH